MPIALKSGFQVKKSKQTNFIQPSDTDSLHHDNTFNLWY